MSTLRRPTHPPRLAQLLRLLIGILIPLLIVGAIAEDLLEKTRFAFETPLLLWIHHFATPTLDRVALTFTTIGGVSVIAPLSALILALLWFRLRPLAYFWAFSVAGAALIDFIMKLIFNRARPELWPRLVHENDASFPSGHSMYSMAFVMALILMLWRTPYRWLSLILGMLFTLCVGTSRLYLGVHYPTDVLAGWLTGLAWVLGVYNLMSGRLLATKPATQNGD